MKKDKKYTFFARDIQVSPIPQHYVMDAVNYGHKKIFGFKLDSGFMDTKKKIEYFSSNWDEFIEKLNEKAKNKKNFVKNTEEKVEIYADKLNKLSREKIYKKDLSKFSNKRLWQIYKKFYETDVTLFTYGTATFFLGFGDNSYAVQNINKILLKRGLSDNLKKKYLSILSSPTRPTFNRQESLAILRLALNIWQNKKAHNAFLYGKIENIEKNFPAIWKKIERHQEKYAFVFYNWEGPAFDSQYFALQIKDILKNGNPKKILEEKKLELTNLKKEINKIYRELKLGEKEKKIVKEAQDIAYLQPYRKMRQFKSMFEIEGLLKEIARRLCISLNQVRFLIPSEIEKYLLSDAEADPNELNSRYRFCVYRYEKGRPRILSGKKAKDFVKSNIVVEKKKIKEKELFGTPAYKGKIKGKVRIVNTLEEGKKLKKGKILVSYATSPTLVPAMRLSGAVITEEGGLTCHAAIVTRELKKPCIVGVENLIDFVKNGDRVEIDANKGVIRKIK